MREKEAAEAEVGQGEERLVLAEELAGEEGGGIRISSTNLNHTSSSSAHSPISSSISGSHRRGISGSPGQIRAPIGGPLSRPR